MNTYTISNNNNNHNHNNNTNTNNNRAARARIQPFDQWSTIKSIERAIQHVEELNNNNSSRNNSPIIEVDFVCAIFETDLPYFLEEYENNNLPCHLTLLKRSTKTEYYNYRNNNTNNTNNNSSANENDVYNYHNFLGDSPKELPFVQDIIDSAITDYYTRREEEEKATKDNNSRNSRNVNTSRADADGTTDQDDLITDHDINDFYIMLTNSDIGLTKDFYQYLLPKLDHREALSINRITIKKTKSIDTISKQYYLNQYNNKNYQNQNQNENQNEKNYQNNNNDENYNNNVISSDNDNDNNNIGTTNTDTDTQLTTILLNEIDTTIQQNKGKIHPGKDCFIIHSTVLKRITIHNMFAGQTPWGNMYHSILMIMAANYTNYKSKQSYNSLVDGNTNTGTYHIGSERKWNKGSPTKKKQLDRLLNKLYYSDNNNSSSSSSSRYYKGLDSCGPSKHPGPYATLNRLNSCILWLPRSLQRFQNNSSNNTTSSSIKNHTNNNYHNNNNNTTNVVIIPNFVQPGYEEFYRNQINSRNLCSDQEKTNMSSWHFHSICPNTS
ncbi:hypothetical protein FRACYDRAFT_237455 [Fragilariopsis cylindrus CCMP1102]|uniref:Uncharacterized protein n=1 Tax=Fragilariopsis cylindrus CCMP1102 TaxID=635003 RepID=A0A1E7FM65_9STRA|nr:hypothetical protein FRACYDRAFT_237455 [Fragilariopsis cylindrus CCMP1102]|eukprot:OEU19165.1 hypothetical protein FRACYDRAFT_237455 [Fragilariopsis cylindrus CCMP1102]